MLNLDRILNHDRLIGAMTGLWRPAFDELLPNFTEAYEHRLLKPEVARQRAIGGGRKATLKRLEEKML
ncbi:hypothetical protein [Phormidesmis priestleyi]